MTGRRALLLGGAVLAAGAGVAQTVPDQQVPETSLNIPANLQIFGKLDPNIRKPTAIVNDAVITGTDVDQRAALTIALNGGDNDLSAEDRDRLKLAMLRQLIDETLQIQEAKANEITVTPAEIKQAFDRQAARFNRTPAQFSAFLRSSGSSDRSLNRLIEGELAWQRYLRRRVEPFVNVGDQEVNAILARLEAARGTDEFALREIYLSATPATQQQVFATARQIIAELQKGKQPFDYFASKFSESSTKSVGGDLGFVKASTLPESLAEAVQQMQVGQVAGPVETPGGFSILYLYDKRQIGLADPRNARLSLKQITVHFPAGISQPDAAARAASFGEALKSLQGCGSVAKVAAGIKAEVVDNDTVRIRDLPPQLQEIMLKLQVGQSTPPFGSPTEGVRALVLCGRDDPKAGALPNPDQVQNQLEEARVNLRAQQKLRDLRRDAVVEYR